MPGAGAALKGDYTSYGTTTLDAGTLSVVGQAEQGAGGTFQLNPGTIVYLTPPSAGGVGVLGIRDGKLTGTGSVQGSLVLGNATNPQSTLPILQPDGGGGSGVILVTGDFTIFNGQIQIGITGPGVYDRVNVGGTAALSGNVIGVLQLAHDGFEAGTRLTFLHADGKLVGTFAMKSPPPNWSYGQDDNADPNMNHDAWFISADEQAANGKIGGKVWDDDAGLARGVLEPGAEGGLAGIVVQLLDAAGTTEIASTETAADGTYSFDNLPADSYTVAFGPVDGMRLAPQYATTDPTQDSDPDPGQRPRPGHRPGAGLRDRGDGRHRRRVLHQRRPGPGGRRLRHPAGHPGVRQRAR